jgi:hypothetical protein
VSRGEFFENSNSLIPGLGIRPGLDDRGGKACATRLFSIARRAELGDDEPVWMASCSRSGQTFAKLMRLNAARWRQHQRAAAVNLARKATRLKFLQRRGTQTTFQEITSCAGTSTRIPHGER